MPPTGRRGHHDNVQVCDNPSVRTDATGKFVLFPALSSVEDDYGHTAGPGPRHGRGRVAGRRSRAWLAAYQSAHGKVSEDARTVVASFGSIGRKANRGSYVLYNLSNGTLTSVTAPANQPDGVLGNAVEFRHWTSPIRPTPTT